MARRRLIEVDQAKPDIERPYVVVMMRRDHYSPQPKDNVKDIIGRSPACQAPIRGDNESQNTRQYQQRSKNKQNIVVRIHRSKEF